MDRVRSLRTGMIAAACAAFVLAGIGCSGRTAAPYEQGAERYQFKFGLTKAPAETGTCTASVSVRDRMARHGFAIPIFTAPWGVTTTASATDSAYGALLEVEVTVDASGQSGAFRASLRRGGQLLASRAASFPVAVVRPTMKATPR